MTDALPLSYGSEPPMGLEPITLSLNEVSHSYTSCIELLVRFELTTSSLRRRRSGQTELKQRVGREKKSEQVSCFHQIERSIPHILRFTPQIAVRERVGKGLVSVEVSRTCASHLERITGLEPAAPSLEDWCSST